MDGGVGAALREARRKREVTLAEVESSTKIRARFLRAIEREEWEQLPGDAYARSFIRTYAAYLGLDGEQLAERQRRSTGARRPAEAIPQVEPAPVRGGQIGRRRRRLPVLPLVAIGLLAAAVAAIVLVSEGEEGPSGPPSGAENAVSPARPAAESGDGAQSGSRAGSERPEKLSLQLTATAEVWVCLLDADGEALVDGQILAPGTVAGPYRSGSFTVSLGNGEVTMTLDGQESSIPPSSDPIGFEVERDGTLSELSEGERPTCT